MVFKTRTIILLGVVNGLIHGVLYIFGFEGLSLGLGNFDNYEIFLALFFTLWATMQLLISRQAYNYMSLNNFNKGFSFLGRNQKNDVKQYFSSIQDREDVIENLRYNISKTDITFEEIDDSEFSLAIIKNKRSFNPKISVRVFSEVDKTTFSTSVDYILNDRVPKIKLILYWLILICTYFGFIVLIPAVLIHFFSMGELMTGRSNLNKDLKKIIEIIQNTM